MSRWELKNQAKGALKDNFGSKMLLFIIPIIAGILGGGNGVKQSMDYNTSNFDSIPGSVWMVISFATLHYCYFNDCCSLVCFSCNSWGNF